MKGPGRVFSLILGFIGLGLLVGAFFALRHTLGFRPVSTEAEGVVVDLEEYSGDDGTMYKPVVEWKDPAGRARRLTGSVASRPPSFSRGEHVRVRYDPADPERARIDSFTENWLLALILG